jgi:hypothetical protein
MTMPEVTGQLLASRVMRERKDSICAKCKNPIGVAIRIGYVDDIGWCQVLPCIVGGRMPMNGPSNEPTPMGENG